MWNRRVQSRVPPGAGLSFDAVPEAVRRWLAAVALHVAVLSAAACGRRPESVGDRPPSEEPPASFVHTMVVIEGDQEAPPFLLDRFEVTNAQFEEFLQATGHAWPNGDPRTWNLALRTLRRREESEHPVVCVTLKDAHAYARWAGKRLPSFREWVRAANRRGRSDYPWGPWPPQQFYTNSLPTRLFSSAPVGAFPTGASESRVHDIVGNVWEWTDTIPDLWSEDETVARKSVLLYSWFPEVLPGLGTAVKPERLLLDQGDPIWFPDLIRGLDSRPEILVRLNPPVRVPYTGTAHLVVGGSFRSGIVSNFKPAELAGEIIYEELERGILSIQLLEPGEWRDDVGIRCARDIGPGEVQAFVDALVQAPPGKRDRIEAALLLMGSERVREHLRDIDVRDRDLAARIETLREQSTAKR
jgi:hypothetical protein